MWAKVSTIAIMVGLAAGYAPADTVYLNTGVRFDAEVTERSDGTYLVQTGDRKSIYRQSDIKAIEKNDKTGRFDKEAAMARWAAKDAKLTEETGLNAEQRRAVKKLVGALQTSSTSERKATRDKLVAMQVEVDIFPYLEYLQPGLSHRLSPWVLEAMFYVDTVRVLKPLRENTQHSYFGTRAKAIELLGRMRNAESQALIVRGLVDETTDVRIQAAYSLANIGAKAATPVLIECLKNPDLKVSNAGREALTELWKAEIGENRPRTVDEWTEVWNAHSAAVQGAFELARLEPLILPEEEFEDE